MENDQLGARLATESGDQPPMDQPADRLGVDPARKGHGLAAVGEGTHQALKICPARGTQHGHGTAGVLSDAQLHLLGRLPGRKSQQLIRVNRLATQHRALVLLALTDTRELLQEELGQLLLKFSPPVLRTGIKQEFTPPFQSWVGWQRQRRPGLERLIKAAQIAFKGDR